MRLEQGGYSLQPASLVIHELSYGIQRLADGRRKERFRSYLQNLLSSGQFQVRYGPWLSFALDLSD